MKKVMPYENKSGLEIGAGSGLFASRLGVRYGVEPSGPMLEKARAMRIEMKQGKAEELPYPDESFDYTLMVTAICFLDDIDKAMEEIRRILKPGVRLFSALSIKIHLLVSFIYSIRRRTSFTGRLHTIRLQSNFRIKTIWI